MQLNYTIIYSALNDFKQWLRSAGNKNHSPLPTLLTVLPAPQPGASQNPRTASSEEGPAFKRTAATSLSDFSGRADSLLGTQQRTANHIPVAPKSPNFQQRACLQTAVYGLTPASHRIWVVFACQLRSGAEGFSFLQRENYSAESLARLKPAAKLYHISRFFIPTAQILSSHLTIALQCRKISGLSHWCFSAARRCMLFPRK